MGRGRELPNQSPKNYCIVFLYLSHVNENNQIQTYQLFQEQVKVAKT